MKNNLMKLSLSLAGKHKEERGNRWQFMVMWIA